MTISVNHNTFEITVPQADLTPISGTLYELNVNTFKGWLSDYLDDEKGMSLDDMYSHNTEVTLSGVTYARFLEILSPYTITFENGNYRVRIVGGNHNIADVLNLNNVQIITQNSAGLVVSGSGITAQDKLDIADRVWDEDATGHTGALVNMKSKTDSLTFTTANKVDSRVDAVGANAVTSPNDFKADVSNLDATISSRSSHAASDIWAQTTRTLTSGTKDTEIDAIKAKTDNLPASPAASGEYTTNLSNIQTDLSNVPANVWSRGISAITAAGSIGKRLIDTLKLKRVKP